MPSMSIGSRFEFDETILDAAKFFIRRILNKDYAKDKLFVFAASNEKNSDVQYSFPANLSSEYGNVMSVTAIGTLDPLGFVPYDEPVAAVGDVDVAAPGVAYTTKPNDTYTRAPLISADIGDGATSFSTPLVSGLAGLLFSLNYDESIDLVEPLTADRVKELIIEGAEDENGGGPQVFGTEIHVINAAKSIELAIEASYPGGGTAVLQPLTGDWAGTNSGNRIEQIFTGVTGVPKSITVYAREWRLRPRGVVISRYAIDTLTVCDNLEDTYGYNEENCFVSQDVGPTADYLVNQAEGSFLSYEFSPAVDVHIRPDQYFRVSLARQTSDSQILEAGGSNSNPIPYSEPQRGIFENPDFDIYFSITTE